MINTVKKAPQAVLQGSILSNVRRLRGTFLHFNRKDSAMFRMWGKIIKDNHLIQDTVSSNGDYTMSRTEMVFQALDEICHTFDLETPIWLKVNVDDFKRRDKTRFTHDSFIETVDFDYLEIQVLEE